MVHDAQGRNESGVSVSGVFLSIAQEGEKDAATGPPYSLMDAPPLAICANGLAAALNELRHCPPLVLQQPVTAVVQVTPDFINPN